MTAHTRGPISREQQDIEANAFAMCLLMPEDMVRRELVKSQSNGSHDILRDMAKKFQVSEIHMGARLLNLGLMI